MDLRRYTRMSHCPIWLNTNNIESCLFYLAFYVHTYELALNSAAHHWKSLALPPAKFWSTLQLDLVRASRKTDGGADEGSNYYTTKLVINTKQYQAGRQQ